MVDPVPPDPVVTSAMTLGTLNLIHINPHLDIPEINGKDGAEGYLVSLSNSVRDLAAIKVGAVVGGMKYSLLISHSACR